MHLKRSLISRLVLFTAVLFTASAWGQMPAPPGPELKKLDYLVGNWTVEGTIGQGPWGAGGKFSSTDTRQWMPGNYFVEGHSDFKMPAELGGDGKAVSFVGYDTEQNVYTFDQFNSQGRHESSKGTVSGDTWTWTHTQNYGGQDVNLRMTTKTISPTSYSLKYEVSLDGTTWMTFMDAKATKK
jgi:hypothetical protein